MARSKKQAAPTMWESADEVPRAGIPSNAKLARRMARNRRVIWACLLAVPGGALSMFVTASSLKASNEAPPAQVQVDSAARAAAMTAVTDWLAGEPAPLPGGELVSWNDFETMPAYVAGPSDTEQDVADAPSLAVHSLTVRDASGATYVAQVLVASNRLGETTVVGTPSLLPVAPASDWASGVSPWPNHDPTTASESVETAVGQWVDAFTSGDPAKLRLVVGDPDTNHSYVPLSGLVGAEHTTTGAAWILDAEGKQTTTMIAQVQITFSWPVVVTDDSRSAPGPAAATYDLLILGADSAAPGIVAWGGPGTGPILTKYANALVGIELVAAPPPVIPQSRPTTEPTTAPDTTEAGTG